MPKTTPVINIDLDKNCKKCGKQEACENGYCLECTMKVYEEKTQMQITEHMIVTAIDKLMKHLNDHHAEIDKAYKNLEEDETGYKIEKLVVSLKVKFEQMGKKIAMQTEIQFSTGKVKDGDKVIFDDKQPRIGEGF